MSPAYAESRVPDLVVSSTCVGGWNVISWCNHKPNPRALTSIPFWIVVAEFGFLEVFDDQHGWIHFARPVSDRYMIYVISLHYFTCIYFNANKYHFCFSFGTAAKDYQYYSFVTLCRLMTWRDFCHCGLEQLEVVGCSYHGQIDKLSTKITSQQWCYRIDLDFWQNNI